MEQMIERNVREDQIHLLIIRWSQLNVSSIILCFQKYNLRCLTSIDNRKNNIIRKIVIFQI